MGQWEVLVIFSTLGPTKMEKVILNYSALHFRFT